MAFVNGLQNIYLEYLPGKFPINSTTASRLIKLVIVAHFRFRTEGRQDVVDPHFFGLFHSE